MITMRLRKSEWRALHEQRQAGENAQYWFKYSDMTRRLLKRELLHWEIRIREEGGPRTLLTPKAIAVMLDHPPHWGLPEGPPNCH